MFLTISSFLFELIHSEQISLAASSSFSVCNCCPISFFICSKLTSIWDIILLKIFLESPKNSDFCLIVIICCEYLVNTLSTKGDFKKITEFFNWQGSFVKINFLNFIYPHSERNFLKLFLKFEQFQEQFFFLHLSYCIHLLYSWNKFWSKSLAPWVV